MTSTAVYDEEDCMQCDECKDKQRGAEKKTIRGHAEVGFLSCATIIHRLGEQINEMSRLSIALEVSDV